jgi:toxin-antitoxin system PIN domain toxin
MRLSRVKHLLDVNVLIALTDKDHEHHADVMRWFSTPGLDWGICTFTEAGFLRLATNPRWGAHSLDSSTAVLAELTHSSGYSFWPISANWATLAAPFRERIFGHQQITDAFLLGLAVQEGGVLVTLDKAIQHLAGARLNHHVLVLA